MLTSDAELGRLVIMAALEPAEERARTAFDLIIRILDFTNEEVAQRVGVSASAVQQKRRGGPRRKPTRLNLTGTEKYARALGVPAYLFGADEPTILRWFADQWAARDSNPEPAD